VKGSHIVVHKFWEGPQPISSRTATMRVIFINPYEGDLALIGTTDIPYEGRPGRTFVVLPPPRTASSARRTTDRQRE
jgi:glycerol-3-phosphate dehydrogenase